jgi:cell cycle checkpoint control protein RAD9A
LQTSIAIDVDEFEDIEVEDKLHIIVSVKDFRAIIQHAGITGNDLSARYSIPARPIQLSYHGDGINCEFLLMTVGERGNPAQKTRKARANGAKSIQRPLDAASRRASAAPSVPPQPEPEAVPITIAPQPASARVNAARLASFDLRRRRPCDQRASLLRTTTSGSRCGMRTKRKRRTTRGWSGITVTSQ